jgi:hypothetical protein
MSGRGMTLQGRRAGDDAGSVFVEAVIAAAIVAVALGGTFRVIADSAARSRAVEARRVALLLAQSEMALVGTEIPLAAGDSAGLAGELVWRVRIGAYAEGSAANSAGALWRVDVSVRPRSGGEPLVSLASLRLGAAER